MKFALAVLLLALATPCLGQELRPAEPSVLYFVSLPFDGESRRDREPLLGFAFQGKRHYESFRMDTRVLNLAGSGGFEVKYLVIGAVAAGAAVAMGSKDSSAEAQRAQQAEAQQYVAANPPAPQPCPAICFGARRF
jgi:hypothetical protein